MELDKIRELIISLQLPALKHDLDSIPIERENFISYHEYLETHLPLLYDCIQQESAKFEWSGETSVIIKQEIQAHLIILLCEICSSNSIFKLNRPDLIHNAERILENLRNISNEVGDLIFKFYQDKLHKDQWKKQLGAVHGFVKYLEFRYYNVDQHMGEKFLTFCLAVALNVRSCFETHYKTLSTSVFITILQHGNKDDIVSLNIHGVVYDAVFKDIHKMDSTSFITNQWNCLLRCLDFFDKFDSFTWNFLDDMMEVLLRNISLSPNNSTSVCLLKFVNKLIVYFTIDHKDFEDFYDIDLTVVADMNDCRLLSKSNTSYTCYRWAKSILQMFIVESHRLMQAKDMAEVMLQEIHKIYILAILPIRLSIIEPHLITFLDKFIAVLMEVLKINNNQKDIAMLITPLLETFYFQLQSPEGSIKLNNFKQNIYLLLKTEVFEKYSSI